MTVEFPESFSDFGADRCKGSSDPCVQGGLVTIASSTPGFYFSDIYAFISFFVGSLFIAQFYLYSFLCQSIFDHPFSYFFSFISTFLICMFIYLFICTLTSVCSFLYKNSSLSIIIFFTRRLPYCGLIREVTFTSKRQNQFYR